MADKTPQELLDEGILTGDMELISKARDLLKKISEPVVKPKRKYVKKAKPKAPKDTPKTFKNETEYLRWLSEQHQKRIEDLVTGKGGSLIGVQNNFVDYDDAFEKDKSFDKKTSKIKKLKNPRRSKVNMLKLKCPRCNREVEIPDYVARKYNFDMNKDDSDLPTFSCGSCGGGV